MKPCPACGYGNPDLSVSCGICGGDIARAPVKAEPVPEKRSNFMLLTGLLLLACGALFYYLQNSPGGAAAPPKNGVDAVSDENYFSYDGVLYGLHKMAALRFLPEADKRRVLPLLSSADDKVASAAAAVVGVWARGDLDGPLRRLWFETLLEAAVSGRPAVRRQAAYEAGFAAAFGFPILPYLGQVRLAAGELAARPETDLKAAGFFLSSMAGLHDLSGQMLETLLLDPAEDSKLYAACALSRLGRVEGHDYLSRVAFSKDKATRSEALACLSYSASSEAGRLLLAASTDRSDAVLAEAAKRGLLLREQLAIIKK